jgi:hypothetical protein
VPSPARQANQQCRTIPVGRDCDLSRDCCLYFISELDRQLGPCIVLPLNELAQERIPAVPTLPVTSVKMAAGPNRPLGTTALSLWTSN